MRFIVIGTAGSGKSTFAESLAERLRIPHVELDALHWLPNWGKQDILTFRRLVHEATEGERWVVDGNYSVVRDVLWPKATDIIWLNPGRATVFARVLLRTIRRGATREVLPTGNTESLRRAFCSRDSILLWSILSYGPNRRRYDTLRRKAVLAHLRWHEVRSAKEANDLLVALTREFGSTSRADHTRR